MHAASEQNLRVKSDEEFGTENIYSTHCIVLQQFSAIIQNVQSTARLFYSATRRVAVTFFARSKYNPKSV